MPTETPAPEQQENPFDAAAIAAEALERGEDPLQSVVGQLAGYASVCWEDMSGTGTFESERAKAAVDSTLEYLRAVGGRTVTVAPEQRLVLRMTETPEQFPDLISNVDDVTAAAAGRRLVLVVDPSIEAYVLEAGAELEVEKPRESWLEQLHHTGPTD